MENNNNSNRFYLNLDNNRSAFPDSRAYPTTPSTFPNPIFPSQGQPGQAVAQPPPPPSQAQQQQSYGTGFAPSGYFMNNPYPPNYPQQPPSSSSSNYQQAPQAPQASYQQRPPPVADATNGLVHQFSHQNLGGRASPYGNRQPSPGQPGQRPRTAGATGQQPYNNYLNAPMPSAPQQSWPEFQPAPERNPDRYGSLAQTNQKKCASLAEAFFKDSVKRARDRNVR